MKFACAPESRPLAGYTIKRAIDRGAFGEVYYALSDAGKEVALKLLHTNQEAELRGVSQCLNLKHANLVALFDIRRDDEGDAWVVMEYIAGESLEQRLSRVKGGLPVDEVLRWIDGFAAGIDYLHGRGIVHRDLKPANVFLDGGVVKIADVGLSKFMTPSRRSAQTESVGTVYYMAPEVAHGKYGRELDVYSLGVIAFEMLTGRVPFEGESTGEILMKHLAQPPDLTDIPERLRPVLARALEKDPAKRTASAGRLAAEFRAAVTGAALPPDRTAVPEATVASKKNEPLLLDKSTESRGSLVEENVASPVPVWLFPALFGTCLVGILLQRGSWSMRLRELPLLLLAAGVWKGTEWWQARTLRRKSGPAAPSVQRTFPAFLEHLYWALSERCPPWLFSFLTTYLTVMVALLTAAALGPLVVMGPGSSVTPVWPILAGVALGITAWWWQRKAILEASEQQNPERQQSATADDSSPASAWTWPMVLLMCGAFLGGALFLVWLIRTEGPRSIGFLVPFAMLMVGGLSAFFSARSRMAQQFKGDGCPAGNGLPAPAGSRTVPVGAASGGSSLQQPPPLPARFVGTEKTGVVRASGPRWSELFTSLAAACVLSALVSTGLALVLPEWDAGWLALRAESQVLSLAISTSIAASLLLAGVWWLERVPGRVRKQRTLLVVLGLLAGASVFLVDGLLGVGPAFAEPGYPGALIDQLGRHRLVVENRATLIGMMLYFGLLFGARSWWSVLSYWRKERFDFWNALATLVIACLVVWVIQFPPTQAFLWGVTLALVLPLAAALREGKSQK